MKRRYVLAGLGLLAMLAVVSSALGGPSLKSLVRKEVAKQLAGKTGPAGSQGAPGTPGAPGAPGSPAASAFLGQVTGVSTTPVEFASPLGKSATDFAPSGVEMGSPNTAIVARDLYVTAVNAPGIGKSRQFELRLSSSGSAIPVGCIMSDLETVCDSGNATGTIPAGDGVTLRITNTGSSSPPPTTIEFGWRATTP
jgi:hypothetical protein